MRRGDLATYPVEWVLRQAASERLSGGFELHGSTPVVIYVAAGDVYLAHVAGEPVDSDLESVDDSEFEAAAQREEERIRSVTLAALSRVLGEDEGWYYFNPIHQHPLRGSWRWPVESLLDDLRRAKRAEGAVPLRAVDHVDEPSTTPPAPSGGSSDALDAEGGAHDPHPEGSPTAPGSAGPMAPTDAPDGWLVAQMLIAEASPTALATRSGWDVGRVEDALEALSRGIQAAIAGPRHGPSGASPNQAADRPDTIPSPVEESRPASGPSGPAPSSAPAGGPLGGPSPAPPSRSIRPVQAPVSISNDDRSGSEPWIKPAPGSAPAAATPGVAAPRSPAPQSKPEPGTSRPEVAAGTPQPNGARRIAEPMDSPPRRPPVPPSLAVEARRHPTPPEAGASPAAGGPEDRDTRRVALRRLIRSMRTAS